MSKGAATTGARTVCGNFADGYRSGGYLADPGSVVDGAEYVIDRDVPAAPLPRWLAGLLTRPAPVP
jgi:hypothetical protein